MPGSEEVKNNKFQSVYRPKLVRNPFNASFTWNVVNTLISSFLAGCMISLGGAVYLSTDSKYLGSALFGIGLFAIFSYGFGLFTGKVGYCVVQDRTYNFLLFPTWIGNLLGTLAVGNLLRLTRFSERLAERADSLCTTKLADGALSILILAFFCGMLMFIASDNYKNATNSVQKYLAVLAPVMVFILCGFEHSVANMFYYTVSACWSFKAIWYLLVVTVGNALGAVVIPLCHMAIQGIRSRQANR